MKKTIIGILLGIVALLGGGYTLGSISTSGDAYNATTTNSFAAQTVDGFKVLKTGGGILGSVVITNDTAGSFNLHDATTTDHLDHATSTLARISASLAEGTYTFDVAFSRGLIVEFQSTNVASSTITWK